MIIFSIQNKVANYITILIIHASYFSFSSVAVTSYSCDDLKLIELLISH